MRTSFDIISMKTTKGRASCDGSQNPIKEHTGSERLSSQMEPASQDRVYVKIKLEEEL